MLHVTVNAATNRFTGTYTYDLNGNLSYGGSALVVNLGVVGVLLNIASQTKTGIRTGAASSPRRAARKRPGGR